MFTKVIFVHRPNSDKSEPNQFIQNLIEQVCRNNEIEYAYPHCSNFADDRTLFVALGGDGTVLNAATLAVKHPNAAVLGINLGHLGFLAEEVGDRIADGTFLSWIGYILREDLGVMQSDQRNVLHVKAERSIIDSKTHYACALNEVTFTPKTMAGMIDVEIYINDEFVCKYKGSGALVSTATGSSAMAASAGGAIIAPNTSVLQIVPVLPHELTIRPIICSSKDTIELRTTLDERTRDFSIAVDGKSIFDLDYTNGDYTYRAIITKAHRRVQFIRPRDYSFFATLSKKMGWNHNGKQ